MSESEVQMLAEAIREDLKAMEGRLNHRIDDAIGRVRLELHELGGDLTVRLERLTPLTERAVAAAERCADKIMVVESDTRALADRFLPKAENERRLRSLEMAKVELEKAREELRGRADDFENQLRVVQSRTT